MATQQQPGRGHIQFIRLTWQILNSPEYARLSPKAVKMLLDIWVQYNGFNNGDLCATWSLMRKRGWRSSGTMQSALIELEQAGWLERTRQGGRHKCNLYALSEFRIDECKRKHDRKKTEKPSKLWMDKIRNAALISV
jgi:hypothetical protein